MLLDSQEPAVMAWEPAGAAGGEGPVPPADADADAAGRRHTFPQPHGGLSRVPLSHPANGVDAVLRELHAGGFTALASSLEGLRPQKVGLACMPSNCKLSCTPLRRRHLVAPVLVHTSSRECRAGPSAAPIILLCSPPGSCRTSPPQACSACSSGTRACRAAP